MQFDNRRRALSIGALIVAGIYWIGLIFVFGLMPNPPSLTSLSSDSESSLEHIVTHLVLGALVYLLLVSLSRNSLRSAVMAFVITVGLGGSLEIAQLFVPERDTQLMDFVSDAIGAGAGVSLVAVVAKYGVGIDRTLVGATALTLVGGIVVTVSAASVLAARPHTVRCDVDELIAAHGGPRATPVPLPVSGRQTDGIIALYLFNEQGGEVVRDLSDVEPPLDLRILGPGVIKWLAGSNGIEITEAGSAISSGVAARKVHDAVKASGQLTVEVWLTPASLSTTGPARAVSISDGKSEFDVNYQAGQSGDDMRERIRTLCSAANQSRGNGVFTDTASVYQLVSTYDGLTLRDYVDGSLYGDRVIGGDLSNWDDDFPLLVGNETSMDRAFLGNIYLLAIYDRALSAEEVEHNFEVGPSGE